MPVTVHTVVDQRTNAWHTDPTNACEHVCAHACAHAPAGVRATRREPPPRACALRVAVTFFLTCHYREEVGVQAGMDVCTDACTDGRWAVCRAPLSKCSRRGGSKGVPAPRAGHAVGDGRRDPRFFFLFFGRTRHDGEEVVVDVAVRVRGVRRRGAVRAQRVDPEVRVHRPLRPAAVRDLWPHPARPIF